MYAWFPSPVSVPARGSAPIGLLSTFVAFATLAACGGDGSSPGPAVPAAPDQVAPQQAAVTYWQDVAPILQRRCVSCHEPGGIGPFRLDTYDAAKAMAGAAAAATKARVMPPWLVTGDGSCGEFRDSAWLSDAEIETLDRWAATGAAAGTPRPDLPRPAPRSLGGAVEYATPLFRPEPAGTELAKEDDYRCFLVDPKLGKDRFLTGYEVTPGDPAMVHHVLLMPVVPTKNGRAANGQPVAQTNAALIAALDAESPDREGWPCYGLAGANVAIEGIPVTWAPGMGVIEYPAGTGVPLPANTQYVVQVHYNLHDERLRGRTESTRVRLRYEDSVARPGFLDLPDQLIMSLFTPTPATLAPGRKAVEFTWELGFDAQMKALGATHLELHGIFPHMHGFGRAQRIEIKKGRPAGGSVCAADVPRWDFDWQLYYFYEKPLRFEPGDTLKVTCTYDTSERTSPVLPGWGSDNEMCMAGVFFVPGR